MRQLAALIALVIGSLATMAGNASAADWLPQVNASAAVPSAEKFDVMSLQDVAVGNVDGIRLGELFRP